MNKILIAKEDCMPLFRKGDKFAIVKRNSNLQLMPIEAMRIKNKKIYGFYGGELI